MTQRPPQPRYAGLIGGLVLLCMVQVVGTWGFHYLGRPTASWIDSFYMTFITISTIGFGEVVDLSRHPLGRLFTVGIAVLGIGTMSYLISSSVALLINTDLNGALRRKRMEQIIARLSQHYIVCGIGRVGSNVARELVATDRAFVVIEADRQALDNWLEHQPDTLYLHDDAASDDALRRAGVMQAAGVFAVTGDDSHNLMVSLSVKLLNAKARVVARLHDIANTQKARRVGADEIVSPDFTGGMRIASAMVRPHVVNFMDQMLHSDNALRVEEIQLPIQHPQTPVGVLVPKLPDQLLMAVREGGRWIFNPEDGHRVGGGTVLVVMTTPAGRLRLQQRVGG